MIEAKLADGRVLRFPDGTDPQVIQRTVKNTMSAGTPIPGAVVPPLTAAQEPKGLVRDIGSSVAEGATAGFSDEIAGALNAALSSDLTLDQAIQVQRNRMNQISPGVRLGGNIAGAIASAPLAGLKAPASIAQAARQGAGLGAVAGAGFAEGGLPERALGAGVGAAVGGPLGAAGQGLIQGGTRAVSALRQGLGRPQTRAIDRTAQELAAAGTTPQRVAAQQQRLGPEALLADVPELQPLAQQTASKTAAGGRIARQALEGRQAQAGQRVEQALDIALGGQNLKAVRQGILSSRKQDAADLYGKALSVGPLQRTQALESLLGKPAAKSSRFDIPVGNDPLRPNLRILTNPTAKQAEALAEGTSSGELRMLRDPDNLDVLFWDAGRATHDQIAENVLGKTMAEVAVVPQSVGQIIRKSAIANHPVFDSFAANPGSTLVRGQLESIRRSNPKFRNLPDNDPLLLHATRVALADRTKGQGAAKRNINDVVQQLTDAMDDAGAEGYREAVDRFRTDSLTLEAFDRGRKALTELPEDIEAFMANAPSGEQSAFIAGLGREAQKRLSTGETGNAAQAVRGLLRGEKAQVLREAMGADSFNALRTRLLRELEFSKTSGRILGGSVTQPRLAGGAEQFRRLGRVQRGIQGIREGGLASGVAELLTAAERPGPRINNERALAQLLFATNRQGLDPTRFNKQSPLGALALQQRLQQGTAPARAAATGLSGLAGGQAAQPLLGAAGF